MICIGAYAACAALARDAVDLGLRVPIANLSFVGSESMLGLLSEGRDREDAERYTRLLVNSQVVPSYEDTSIPAVREYRDFMERYDPQVPVELVTEPYIPFDRSFVSLEGFLDAKIMVKCCARLGDEPSRSDLERAIMTLQDFELGISERVTFAEGRRQGLQQIYYTVVDDGRFVTLSDWEGIFPDAGYQGAETVSKNFVRGFRTVRIHRHLHLVSCSSTPLTPTCPRNTKTTAWVSPRPSQMPAWTSCSTGISRRCSH